MMLICIKYELIHKKKTSIHEAVLKKVLLIKKVCTGRGDT